MDNKSYVSLEQHLCMVCATPFDTGSILLDRRLRASMRRYTRTGWGLCPEHQRLHSEGFVCVFRSIVTARFGIVTAEFGIVTGHFGDVTDGVFAPA